MSLVYCIFLFNFNVHDSVAISSVDTGPESVTPIYHYMHATHLPFNYYTAVLNVNPIS